MVASNTTPFLAIYKREGDTFTRMPNPVSAPAGAGNAVSMPAGALYVSVAHDTTPFITTYKGTPNMQVPLVPAPAPRLGYFVKTGESA